MLCLQVAAAESMNEKSSFEGCSLGLMESSSAEGCGGLPPESGIHGPSQHQRTWSSPRLLPMAGPRHMLETGARGG